MRRAHSRLAECSELQGNAARERRFGPGSPNGGVRCRERLAMRALDAGATRANRSRSCASGPWADGGRAGTARQQKKKRRESTGGGSRRDGARTALLLVASPLQELSLLVLSHLLAALLDHTTHWNLPGPRGLRRAGFEVSSGCPHRTRSSGCFEAGVRGAGTFRGLRTPCQANPGARPRPRGGRIPSGLCDQAPSKRSTKRLRTLPSIRLTTWRRGRKGRIGRRRMPRSAIASRIST